MSGKKAWAFKLFVLYSVIFSTVIKYTIMKEWIEKYFNEQWKDINTNIDFSKYEPISTSNSLHIHEERYKIENNTYRLLYSIGHDGDDPNVEVLVE